MNALKTKIVAYKLNYHWYFIRKFRKKMRALFRQESSLSDETMLHLNKKLSRHCSKAARLDRLFLALTAPKNI